MTWELTIPIAPKQRMDPRPIHRPDPDAKIRALMGQKPKAGLSSINDPDYELWLDQCSKFIKAHRPRPMFTEAVILSVIFHVQPHKRIPDELLGLPHAATPDLDRYLHAIQDACTHGGVWEDDKLVSASFQVKVWSTDRKFPHIDVLVLPFDSRKVLDIRRALVGGGV